MVSIDPAGELGLVVGQDVVVPRPQSRMRATLEFGGFVCNSGRMTDVPD